MCDIGKKMYQRRKELGLTLEEVGEAVGVGKSTVRRWENGMIKNMGRDKIAALARVLRMSPVEFVPGDDEPKPLTMEDQQRLEALHQDPRLRLLFDRARKISHDDVEFMIQYTDRILKERDGE
jgi:transcriptional regulator with XRE-family HTH domain